jgi:hypothetical protein
MIYLPSIDSLDKPLVTGVAACAAVSLADLSSAGVRDRVSSSRMVSFTASWTYRDIYFREATKIYHYFRGLYEEAREGEETIRGIEAWGTKNRKFAKKVAWSASRGKHRARGTKTGTV